MTMQKTPDFHVLKALGKVAAAEVIHAALPWLEAKLKRGCQHPSNKFEMLWQVAQNSFSRLLSYFIAQYVLVIVV